MASKERPQREVGFDAVVESVNQRVNLVASANAADQVTIDERPMRLWMSQESAVLHAAPSG